MNAYDRFTLEKLYFLSGWLYSITAFFTLFLVLGTVIYARNQLRQNARQNAWDNLFSTFDMIDLYIARNENEIKKAGINQKYKPKSGMVGFLLLLHDIDLIYRYWIHQKALTPDERKGFENWIDTMFFNWIAEHKDKLLVDYESVMNRKDLYSEKFLCWLKKKQDNSVSLKMALEIPDCANFEALKKCFEKRQLTPEDVFREFQEKWQNSSIKS